MSNAARIAVPGSGDNGKVAVYNSGTDAWDLVSLSGVTFVTKSAAWALSLVEAECFYLDDNTGAHNVTIPLNSSVAVPVGSSYSGQQRNSLGTATFVATGGVTLDVRNGTVQSAGQHAVWTLLKTGTDRWLLTGDLI